MKAVEEAVSESILKRRRRGQRRVPGSGIPEVEKTMLKILNQWAPAVGSVPIGGEAALGVVGGEGLGDPLAGGAAAGRR